MITKNYIKMCEKAEEIQKLCQYKQGDWFINIAHEFEVIPSELPEKMKEWYKYYHIYLPTQEQLQEMVDWDKAINNSTNIINSTWKRECREGLKLCLLYDFYKDGISNRFDTIKETMFAFVMKEKYNKVWNGEDWVKEDK